jgi:hypothetical protein
VLLFIATALLVALGIALARSRPKSQAMSTE